MKRRQLATALDVSLSTVVKLVRERQIPIIRIGKAIRIRRSEVERYLKNQTVPARAAAEERPSA